MKVSEGEGGWQARRGWDHSLAAPCSNYNILCLVCVNVCVCVTDCICISGPLQGILVSICTHWIMHHSSFSPAWNDFSSLLHLRGISFMWARRTRSSVLEVFLLHFGFLLKFSLVYWFWRYFPDCKSPYLNFLLKLRSDPDFYSNSGSHYYVSCEWSNL